MKKYIALFLLVVQGIMMMGMEIKKTESLPILQKRNIPRVPVKEMHSTPNMSNSSEFGIGEQKKVKHGAILKCKEYAVNDHGCSPTARSHSERSLSFEEKSLSITNNS